MRVNLAVAPEFDRPHDVAILLRRLQQFSAEAEISFEVQLDVYTLPEDTDAGPAYLDLLHQSAEELQ